MWNLKKSERTDQIGIYYIQAGIWRYGGENKTKVGSAARCYFRCGADWRETKAETEFKYTETEVVIYACNGETGMEKALSMIVQGKSLPGNMNFHWPGIIKSVLISKAGLDSNASFKLWVYSWFHIWKA